MIEVITTTLIGIMCAILGYIAHKLSILNDVSHEILYNIKELRKK